MQIRPRQQLLDIWRHTVKASYPDGEWRCGGDDSISDADQLLCLLAPATRLSQLRLSRPDTVARDVRDSLRLLGDSVGAPQRLVELLTAHIDRYTAGDGTPIFSAGDQIRSSAEGNEVTAEQRSWDVVESYAVAVSLMLAVISFTEEFRGVVSRPDLLGAITDLQARASTRLTAAMVGLLRSFTVNVFTMDGPLGVELMRTVNQGGRAPEQVAEQLHESLTEVIAGLRKDLTIGAGPSKRDELENPYSLFECGWSWGIVDGAAPVETSANIGRQRDGTAEGAPYLHFTTVAMEAAQALASERTRLPGWLDAEQLRLAQQVQVRAELVRAYWATVATFGQDNSWPIEDLPWRTNDGLETDYHSLLVAGLVIPALTVAERSGTGLPRIRRVLERLAERSRITARPTAPDRAAVEIHHPGIDFPLVGSSPPDQPQLRWTFTDMAPLLLKRSLEVAEVLPDEGQRREAVQLAERIWEHLERRRLPTGAGEGLWDRPQGAFPQLAGKPAGPSWYYTRRVVDCLVTAARLVTVVERAPDHIVQIATSQLHRAERLLDRELMDSPGQLGDGLSLQLEQIGVQLRLARDMLADEPSVTLAFADEALRELGRFIAARRAASRRHP